MEAPKKFSDLMGEVKALPASARAFEGPPELNQVRVAAVSPLRISYVDGGLTARATDTPPSVVRQLVHGPLLPYSTLDLHGLSVIEASAELRAMIPSARRKGLRCLVVISGRGIHSPGGIPTIAELVVTELSVTLAAHVLAFRTAPPRFGGEGALIVRLRP